LTCIAELLVVHNLHHDDFLELHDVPTDELSLALNALKTDVKNIPPKEHAIGHFTHRKLKDLTTWPL
jgi:hypothetical protein